MDDKRWIKKNLCFLWNYNIYIGHEQWSEDSKLDYTIINQSSYIMMESEMKDKVNAEYGRVGWREKKYSMHSDSDNFGSRG